MIEDWPQLHGNEPGTGAEMPLPDSMGCSLDDEKIRKDEIRRFIHHARIERPDPDFVVYDVQPLPLTRNGRRYHLSADAGRISAWKEVRRCQ